MKTTLCPNCQIETVRVEKGSTTTLGYFPPKYNEEGININPDRNTITKFYKCLNCNLPYKFKGNNTDGFEYEE